MLEILSHFRKKRIFGPISSQNMRVIKRFVETCLFHLEMKENNTSYFVTCHPLSSLQSISMAYGQTAFFSIFSLRVFKDLRNEYFMLQIDILSQELRLQALQK